MSNKKTETLPAVKTESFALAKSSEIPPPPADLIDQIDDNDLEGYEQAGTVLPIVGIRQKEKKDDKSGKTLFDAGGFRIYDAVSDSNGSVIPDVPAETGLELTVLADRIGRTFWGEFGKEDKPLCKSIDGLNGMPRDNAAEGYGGNCAQCPMAQWANGDRPQCSEERNILVYDHKIQTAYLLRLGRSGIRPWNNFRTLIKRMSVGGKTVPPHLLRIHVSTRYEGDPAPHYVPVFSILGWLDGSEFGEMKQIRNDQNVKFEATVQVDTVDDEHPAHDSRPHTSDPGGELPPDAQPVESGPPDRDNKDGEDLPF